MLEDSGLGSDLHIEMCEFNICGWDLGGCCKRDLKRWTCSYFSRQRTSQDSTWATAMVGQRSEAMADENCNKGYTSKNWGILHAALAALLVLTGWAAGVGACSFVSVACCIVDESQR